MNKRKKLESFMFKVNSVSRNNRDLKIYNIAIDRKEQLKTEKGEKIKTREK